MTETAEPIEVLAMAAALLACCYSLILFVRAVQLAQSAHSRRPSVRTIAWVKATSELVRGSLAGMVLWADLVQVLAPPPGSPAWSRPWLQLIWVLLGCGLLLLSGLHDLATQRIIRQIEQEDEG